MNLLALRPRRVRAAVAGVALCAIAPSALLTSSCSPPGYQRVDGVEIALALEPSEVEKTTHLTFVVRTKDADLPMQGSGFIEVTVCRRDERPFGSELGEVRIVGDAPSTDTIVRTLDGSSACASVDLELQQCDVARASGSEARCGLSIAIDRGVDPSEAPALDLVAGVAFRVAGDVDAPSDLTDELWVDD